MEADKQILFASKYAYMYYQYVSEAFQDYSLQFTQNGKQAISYLRKHTPSVVILGENLKELNTLKLCKAIRNSSRLSATKIMLLVPDHTNVLELDTETSETVDIILRHTQKPSAFVTHIGKLLKASEDLNAKEADQIEASQIKTSQIESSQTELNSSELGYTEYGSIDTNQQTKSTAKTQPKDTIDTGESMASAIVAPQNHSAQDHTEAKKFIPDNNDDLVVVHEHFHAPALTSAPKPPIAPPGHYQSLQEQTQEFIQPAAVVPIHPGMNTSQLTTTSAVANPSISESSQAFSPASSQAVPTNQYLQTDYPIDTNDMLPITPKQNALDDISQTDTTVLPQETPLIENQASVSSFNATNSYGQSSSDTAAAKTIAIIEDNASIAFLEKSILERQGYNTIQISDAPQARDFVDTHFDMADLILLDLNLPGGSGFEILRRIRSFSRKPVIIVSGLKQSENIKRGLSLGAQDYLTKPMNPQELILRVSQHIKNFG